MAWHGIRCLRSNFNTHIFIRRHMASYGVFDPEFEFLVASSLFYPLFLKYNILPTLTVAEHLTWRIVKIRRRALSVSLRRACSAKVSGGISGLAAVWPDGSPTSSRFPLGGRWRCLRERSLGLISK